MIREPMATVYIPSMLKPMAGNRDTVDVTGATVREIVEKLAAQYPGLGSRLVDGGQLRSSISVAIDGEISTLGLLDSLDEASEVHFIPAIAGGRGVADADSLG